MIGIDGKQSNWPNCDNALNFRKITLLVQISKRLESNELLGSIIMINDVMRSIRKFSTRFDIVSLPCGKTIILLSSSKIAKKKKNKL